MDATMSTAADNWPYSAREAAALLGVSERTIRRAIARGDLPATRNAGVFRISPDALSAYANQRQRSPLPRTASGSRPRAQLPEPVAPRHLLHLVTRADGPAFDVPRPLTPFLGRDREVAAIVAMLSQPEIRLLSLTGPGGVGKTRLALQVAQELAPHFADGVAFVSLGPIVDASVVPSAVAQALGVHEHGDRPIGERLAAALRERQLLLVLDNFEHVLPAATLVVELLSACRALTILVTSRAPLDVSGEYRFPVPPMSLPDAAAPATGDIMPQGDAVRFFVARAQAALPNFALTDDNAGTLTEICHHLDGLPLAIELAAARVPLLPPKVLLARLERRLPLLTGGPRDAPERLQTMRNAIAWSYDFLSESEQALFRRLAIFIGGCTLEAAEYVGGDGLAALGGDGLMALGGKGGEGGQRAESSQPLPLTLLSPLPPLSAASPPERSDSPSVSVMEGIFSLVTSSLLQRADSSSGEPRFGMLETIREFALEQLALAGEDAAARRRHADYYLAMCEQGYPNHFGPYTNIDQRHQQLENEQPNVRVALAYMASVGDAGGVLRLAGALGLFWQQRGHLREGRHWLEWALSHTAEAPTDARCRALVGLGSILGNLGEPEQAILLVRSALAIAETNDIPEKAAHAIHVLGFLTVLQHRWEEAEVLFADALARWHALDAWGEEAVALIHLSRIALGRGDCDLAARHAEASLTRSRALGYSSAAGLALSRLGQLARARRDDRDAALAYQEALGLWASRNDHWYITLALAGLAEIASAHGQAPVAAILVGAINTLAEAAGSLYPDCRVNHDRAATVARGALGQERFDELRAAGHRLSLSEAVAIAATVSVPAAPPGGALTTREIDVLRLVAAGRTDREIAGTLFLSRRTINAHVAHILAKLQVRTRHEASERARDLGLLESAGLERYT